MRWGEDIASAVKLAHRSWMITNITNCYRGDPYRSVSCPAESVQLQWRGRMGRQPGPIGVAPGGGVPLPART
jgi:hypothetical protein